MHSLELKQEVIVRITEIVYGLTEEQLKLFASLSSLIKTEDKKESIAINKEVEQMIDQGKEPMDIFKEVSQVDIHNLQVTKQNEKFINTVQEEVLAIVPRNVNIDQDSVSSDFDYKSIQVDLSDEVTGGTVDEKINNLILKVGGKILSDRDKRMIIGWTKSYTSAQILSCLKRSFDQSAATLRHTDGVLKVTYASSEEDNSQTQGLKSGGRIGKFRVN